MSWSSSDWRRTRARWTSPGGASISRPGAGNAARRHLGDHARHRGLRPGRSLRRRLRASVLRPRHEGRQGALRPRDEQKDQDRMSGTELLLGGLLIVLVAFLLIDTLRRRGGSGAELERGLRAELREARQEQLAALTQLT